jgi:H+/Cl- antiporter ClcA
VFSFAASIYLVALLVIHLLAPRLEQVEDIEAMPSKPLSVGTFVGFGFIGLIFGSFVGWCLGLISRVDGQSLLEYMVLAGLVGALVGVIVGFLTVTAGHRSQAA